MIVANVTTPANMFHLLRRQVTWDFRKPCIVFSPKSLLRHPKVVSPLADFTKGGFQELIDDENVKAANVKKVAFCSGKIYYDLLEEQEQQKQKNVAIVRIEQLHPFPEKQFDKIVKKYAKAQIAWVQEEPSNMGSWAYILRTLSHKIDFEIISRKPSASPATGFAKIHKKEQSEIIKKAFEIKK